LHACDNCAVKLLGDERFCPNCGTKVAVQAKEAEAAPGGFEMSGSHSGNPAEAAVKPAASVTPGKVEAVSAAGPTLETTPGIEAARAFLQRKEEDQQFAMRVNKCANAAERDELLKKEGYSFTNEDLKEARKIFAAEKREGEDADLRESLKGELRKWGVALIILGVIHFALAGFLDPVWGVVILVIGTLNLFILKPQMLIVNGGALILVGLINIITTLAIGFSGWVIFGGFQIYWGIQEIVRYENYAALG